MPTEVTLSGAINFFRQGVSVRTPRQYFATNCSPFINSADSFRYVASGTSYSFSVFDDTTSGRGPGRLTSKNTLTDLPHELEISNYGQSDEFIKGVPFEDLDGPTSGSVIQFIGKTSHLSRYPYTLFNKTFRDLGQLDGVMEPLTIRSEIDFSSPEGSDTFHKTRATLGGSFEETFRGNLPIIQQVAFSPTRAGPFLDHPDTFGPSSEGEISLPGLIMDEKNDILPFKDASVEQSRGEDITDSEIRAVLMTTTGSSTVSMFIRGYRSSTAGFTYSIGQLTGTNYGTDSIAFGGLKK